LRCATNRAAPRVFTQIAFVFFVVVSRYHTRMQAQARKIWRGAGVILLVVIVCGCERKAAESSATSLQAPLGSDRPLSVESVMRGARLYQEHCAQCHGPEAQGHPDWQNPQVVAAPPLDGTGNEWKRKRSDLIAIVKKGITRNNAHIMPAWAERLSDQEIEDIVAWFQALWPMDVYDRWLKVNAGGSVPDKPDKKG
jgi:mono/diheme cytochrome c family protein